MSSPEKTHKRPRLWLILSCLLIGLLCVVFACWQYYKRTPAYALAVMAHAAQHHDAAAFDQVVDVDLVIDNLIPQVLLQRGVGISPNPVTVTRKHLQSLAPERVAYVRQMAVDVIQNRINELAGSSRPFAVTALAVPFMVEINQNGDTAQVKTKDANSVELIMQRREGTNWKVVSINDSGLALRVVDDIIKDLPRSESELQQQLRTLPENLPQLPLLK